MTPSLKNGHIRLKGGTVLLSEKAHGAQISVSSSLQRGET